MAECLREEWDNRRRLAEGVSTPRLERIFESTMEAGGLAAKVCGAGGGGCFIALIREGTREAVEQAIRENGGRVLDYRLEDTGVRVVE